MADPLSIAASITALLQAAGFVFRCAKNIKNASDEQKFFKIELEHFIKLLKTLKERVEQPGSNGKWFEQIQLLCDPGGLFDHMYQRLSSLEAKLRQQNATRLRWRAKLLWTVDRGDLQGTLSDIERLKSVVTLALQDDHFNLSLAIKADTSKTVQSLTELQVEAQRQAQKQAIEWLKPPDSTQSYHLALQKRQEGTGQWFLNNPLFAEWIESPSCFWLYGQPGCGKTTLSSTVIEHILSRCANAENHDIAHFFFDSSDSTKKTAGDLLRSLLAQFGNQRKTNLEIIRQLYRDHCADYSQPSNAELVSALKELISIKSKAYLVIDGLEESSELTSVLKIIRELLHEHTENLHLFATSRVDKTIKDHFEAHHLRKLEITPDLIRSDIQHFVTKTLDSEPQLQKWKKNIRDKILSTLTSKSDGMFQWVYCQIEELKKCVTEKKLMATLETLPKTLNETYERLLKRIEEDGYFEEAIRVLQWVCHAQRPMRRAELVDCLAIDLGEQPIFCEDQRIPDPDDILKLCSSLITVRTSETDQASHEDISSRNVRSMTEHNDPEVRLSHFSVREYLLSSRCQIRTVLLEKEASAVITQSCLVYLLRLCEFESLSEETLDRFPLARYAARFWYEHLNALSWMKPREDILDSAVKLLKNHPRGLDTWRFVVDIDERCVSWPSLLSVWCSALFAPDGLGIDECVPLLVDATIPPEPGTAFYHACLTGNIALVKRLLSSDIDLNVSHGGRLRFPLAAALSSGRNELWTFLVSNGAKTENVPKRYLLLAYVRFVQRVVGALSPGTDVIPPSDWAKLFTRVKDIVK